MQNKRVVFFGHAGVPRSKVIQAPLAWARKDGLTLNRAENVSRALQVIGRFCKQQRIALRSERVVPMEIHRLSKRAAVRRLRCRLLPVTLTLALSIAWCLISYAQETNNSAKLTFTKVLKGSVPEFLAIAVDSAGSGTYEGRKLSDPPSPRDLKLSMATTQRLFELAGTLNNFRSIELESHKKVANLGLKTFIYEAGGQKNQVEFNYTQRREATELTELFEKIATVQQHITTLEHAIKYDHLSLPKELLQIRIDLEKKALADSELMVPMLEQIARNPRFLHLAQARAQDILRRLRNSSN